MTLDGFMDSGAQLFMAFGLAVDAAAERGSRVAAVGLVFADLKGHFAHRPLTPLAGSSMPHRPKT